MYNIALSVGVLVNTSMYVLSIITILIWRERERERSTYRSREKVFIHALLTKNILFHL